jgi:IMP dehydrogenase
MSYRGITNPLDSEFLTTSDVALVPQRGTLRSRKDVEIKPFVYSAPMDTVTGFETTSEMLRLGEFPVVSRFISEEERTRIAEKWMGHPNLFWAIGLNDAPEFIAFAQKHLHHYESLASERTSLRANIAIDIAHGDMDTAHELVAEIRADDSLASVIGLIMSGSICTPSAAERAFEAGCTHLRIGVGPGAACTTRLMTGIGVPQLSAVYNIHKELRLSGTRELVTLIADGGIKHPGEAVKYLAAGADAIMMGSAFSKALESPGWTKHQQPLKDFLEELAGPDIHNPLPIPFPLPEPPVRLSKSYRGQASGAFQKDIYGKKNICPEGASSEVFFWDSETTVESIVLKYRGGLASAMSYLGIETTQLLNPENANVVFIKQTPSAYVEGTPHGT